MAAGALKPEEPIGARLTMNSSRRYRLLQMPAAAVRSRNSKRSRSNIMVGCLDRTR